MCLFNVISVITTSSNHARLVDFNAPLLESPFALMKACCQLAETLVSFLLLQQLSEDFYYYLSCWLVLQQAFEYVCNPISQSLTGNEDLILHSDLLVKTTVKIKIYLSIL